MEKYIVTENTVQYFENGSLVWKDQLNNNKEQIIQHLAECNANYEVVEVEQITIEEQMINELIQVLNVMNIPSEQWEHDYLSITGSTYDIRVETTGEGYNVNTVNNEIYEEESEKRYGDTNKANGNHKEYKTIKGVINYITKYWDMKIYNLSKR